jgi:sugar lactone lactonase YvrE
MPTAEQITEPVAYHAEGPVWSLSWGGLRWVDMLAGDVLSLDADGTIGRRRVGDIAAAVRPRAGGGAVIAVERGFALEEPDGTIRRLGDLWADVSIRMNEGGCDPAGRFYCGSMDYDAAPGRGSLYRLDPDGTVTTILSSVTISNGLEWTPDGTRAYYVDTPTRRIDVFDYDPAEGLSGRRAFVDAASAHGRPDGLTVDAEGGVWVAFFGGSAVRRYTPDGRLDLVVDLPVRQITACAFGGENLDRLYITTSREHLSPDDEPTAGALYAYDAGVRGLPVRPFAG